MRILLTGAAGFVGSHVLRRLYAEPSVEVIYCPVTYRHKGASSRLRWALNSDVLPNSRVKVFSHDLTGPFDPATTSELKGVDVIMNVASESHVDRSIADPVPFVRNNVDLILNMLELARLVKPALFLQMSTDEVYGPATHGEFHGEWSPIIPSNPYSASKAAQEAVAISYWRTYNVPLVLTNTMNVYGETQNPEKYMPLIMRCVASGVQVPVHVDDDGVPGSRTYIHASDFADAWWFLTQRYVNKGVVEPYSDKCQRPPRYNIVGDQELDNRELAELVAHSMQMRLQVENVNFHATRPGHDTRYALDGFALASLGWQPKISIEKGVKDVTGWTVRNPEWLAL